MSGQTTLTDNNTEDSLCGVCMQNEWIIELTFVRGGESEFDITGKFCGDCGSNAQELILAAQKGGQNYDRDVR